MGKERVFHIGEKCSGSEPSAFHWPNPVHQNIADIQIPLLHRFIASEVVHGDAAGASALLPVPVLKLLEPEHRGALAELRSCSFERWGFQEFFADDSNPC